MTTENAIKIRKGRSKKPGPALLYPFDKLKAEGDYFDVIGTTRKPANYGSIRAQASKQRKVRGIKYNVEKRGASVRVWYDGAVNNV